jgi:hypothetical protein
VKSHVLAASRLVIIWIMAIQESPGRPASVERYLRGKFGEGFAEAKRAMERLARSMPPDDLMSGWNP